MDNEVAKREKQEVRQASPEQLVDAGNAYLPDVDILDTKEALVMALDLPGVAKGDVSIEIDENNVLSIRGKTTFSEPEGIVYKEFNTGNYYRAFTLSDEFDKDKISAKLDNGVLQVTVPRREEVKPRKVQISA
ncbi:MAG: Hsp20/alpha crystallin family protein [Chitinispirillaceae bacterium]